MICKTMLCLLLSAYSNWLYQFCFRKRKKDWGFINKLIFHYRELLHVVQFVITAYHSNNKKWELEVVKETKRRKEPPLPHN